MPFELFVALRFLREGRLQTLLIFVGVGVGVGVMVFLSALITGLQGSLIRQTLSTQAHVVVRSPDRRPRVLPANPGEMVGAEIEKATQRLPRIDEWAPIKVDLESVVGVLACAPTVAGSAFVHRGASSAAIALRGVDSASYGRIVPVSEKLTSGRFDLQGSLAVIGIELAQDLGVRVGDKLRLDTAAGRDSVVTVSGIFDLGNKDVNQRWVFISLRLAQTLLALEGSVSTFEIRVSDPFAVDPIALEIARRTGLVAEPWTRLNKQLLIALNSQSSSSIMIQVFVILAVALGIASVLVVSVMQKSREIGILRATGTRVGSITAIFLIQGWLVGAVGSVVGSLLGTALALLFARMAVNPDGSALFPVDLGAPLFVRAILVAMGVGLAAAVAPARRAARMEPAVAIRHV